MSSSRYEHLQSLKQAQESRGITPMGDLSALQAFCFFHRLKIAQTKVGMNPHQPKQSSWLMKASRMWEFWFWVPPGWEKLGTSVFWWTAKCSCHETVMQAIITSMLSCGCPFTKSELCSVRCLPTAEGSVAGTSKTKLWPWLTCLCSSAVQELRGAIVPAVSHHSIHSTWQVSVFL